MSVSDSKQILIVFKGYYGRMQNVHKDTGRGVTANMLVLGTSDSGFESRRPDTRKKESSRYN